MKQGRKVNEVGIMQKDREAFIQHLFGMGYKEEGVRHYKRTINRMAWFMLERGLTSYSADVGKSFLAGVRASGEHSANVLQRMECCIRRFDCFLNCGEYVFSRPYVGQDAPPQFAEGLADYLGYIKNRGLRDSTIKMRRENITRALLSLDESGVRGFSEIRPEHIYCAFEKSSGKCNFSTPMRGLLRYLHKAGIMANDYSEFVPTVRIARPIPSVYTTDETSKLLESVEEDAATRKRNNAIVLLALRLGIRSGDIANLKITDLDFKSKEIRFVQEKTLVPQRLELLPEIEDALLSYIEAARPESRLPNIFLSLNAPARVITKSSVYWLVSSRFRKSGVDTGERRRGGHSLRATLASELVAEKVPYDAVRRILGQEDPGSTSHYVHFDIESLRSCSLEIPAVTGNLAAYMQERLGGGAR
jgi:site-specific recombinase XerD